MTAGAADFDRVIDRRGTWSSKWEKYAGRDILPFWVADMDFAMPDFIREAVQRRLDQDILGYTRIPPPLVEAFLAWLDRHYGWRIPDSWLVWLPGVVTGFNLAARTTAVAGGSIVIPTPVYYPFLDVPAHADQQGILVPLVRDGSRWVMDPDALEAAVRPHSRILLLANPQNPTGRAYTPAELEVLADFCLRHDLVLCSDEIHCQLLLDERARHVPVASLSPEIAARTISLFAATKTYNIPGLSCAVAVIPDADLRRRFKSAQAGLVPSVGPLEYAASAAAFADTGPWVPALLAYLRDNHQLLQAVAGDRMTPVEATYLAWIDVRDLALPQPGAFFEQHGIGLSDGATFGAPGYLRFNFGCPRSMLEQGLERLAAGLRAAEARAGDRAGNTAENR
jgi:cysteine-S-conjugate beta-lyase